MSVSASIQDQTRNIHEYIRKMDELLRKCLRQQKTEEGDEEEEKVLWKTKPSG